MEKEEQSEELRLLRLYCLTRDSRRGVALPFRCQGPGPSRPQQGIIKHSQQDRSVVDCLTDIADSAPITDGDLKTEDSSPEDQEDLVEKLVALLKKHGDDFNEQIQQNKVLQQQLCAAFSYSLFEKLMSCVPQWGGASGRSAPSDDVGRRQQIAWAFEVTSRLSAIELIPKRRALSIGEHFLCQHYSAWVQEQGGWVKVFPCEELD